MPKTKAQKTDLLESYKDRISASKGMIFIRPKGLSANETVEFKKALSDLNAEYRVVKNTIFKLAMNEGGLPVISEFDFGANGVVFCNDDVVAVAKLIKEFTTKLEEKMKTSQGILAGALVTESQVAELADMPPMEIIIANIAGLLTNPIGSIANVLQDSVAGIASIMDQADKFKTA